MSSYVVRCAACPPPAGREALADASPTPAELKALRTVFSNAASLVSNRQVKSTLLIYANDPDSQSDGGVSRGVTIKPAAVWAFKQTRLYLGRAKICSQSNQNGALVGLLFVEGRSRTLPPPPDDKAAPHPAA